MNRVIMRERTDDNRDSSYCRKCEKPIDENIGETHCVKCGTAKAGFEARGEVLKVGDVVEHSGGYNCTRTEFYIIAGFNKSGKKASIQRVQQKQVDGDWMNGNVAPDFSKLIERELHEVMVKSDYKGEMMLRGRINHTVRDEATGEVKWVNRRSIENFYKWDGKPIWNNCD